MSAELNARTADRRARAARDADALLARVQHELASFGTGDRALPGLHAHDWPVPDVARVQRARRDHGPPRRPHPTPTR